MTLEVGIPVIVTLGDGSTREGTICRVSRQNKYKVHLHPIPGDGGHVLCLPFRGNRIKTASHAKQDCPKSC